MTHEDFEAVISETANANHQLSYGPKGWTIYFVTTREKFISRNFGYLMKTSVDYILRNRVTREKRVGDSRPGAMKEFTLI
jgi:hypothetical protein